jgi:5'-nucleotidase
MKKLFPVVITIVLVLVAALAVVPAGAKPSGTVDVQILALNDFHGNLLPPSGSSGRVGTIDAGGVEYLATHISNLRNIWQHTSAICVL